MTGGIFDRLYLFYVQLPADFVHTTRLQWPPILSQWWTEFDTLETVFACKIFGIYWILLKIVYLGRWVGYVMDTLLTQFWTLVGIFVPYVVCTI